jgi:two-component system chemotaxis response regulator CheB
MSGLRVLVVEDSATIRNYLGGVLQRNDMEVIGEASNGAEAVEMCARLRPDIVTMDMMLPEMNGVLATERIMAYSPTPILIVSASVNRNEALRTYEALAAGAVDVLDKPKADQTTEEWEQRFIASVRMVARIRVITHPRGKLNPSIDASTVRSALVTRQSYGPGAQVKLIAIGASTGGPGAIAQVLKALPANYPIPIVVVLHISELFAFAFADWLATQVHLPARLALDGEPLPFRGTSGILLAQAGKHMIVNGGRIRLTTTEERNSCRPSIDELFESVAREVGNGALLCLLTGMGKDGAEGLLAGRKAGADTIAQDEASSVVFGMPGEAIRMGAAQHVMGLDEMAEYLKSLAGAV